MGFYLFYLLQIKNYIFGGMQTEKYFTFSRISTEVGVTKETADKMRKSLNFESRSQFFLRIPDKVHLYMIIFCMVGKSSKMTKNLNKTLNSLGEGIKKQIETLYINKNSERKGFNAPLQLEILSKTLNYNQKIFKECSIKFTDMMIEYPLSALKKSENLMFKYFGSKDTEIGQSANPEKIKNCLLLMEENDQKSLILAAFGNEPPARESLSEQKLVQKETDSQMPSVKEVEKKGGKTGPKKSKSSSKGQKGEEGERKGKNQKQPQINSEILKEQIAERLWNTDSWIFMLFMILVLIILLTVLSNPKLSDEIFNRIPPINTNFFKLLFGEQ